MRRFRDTSRYLKWGARRRQRGYHRLPLPEGRSAPFPRPVSNPSIGFGNSYMHVARNMWWGAHRPSRWNLVERRAGAFDRSNAPPREAAEPRSERRAHSGAFTTRPPLSHVSYLSFPVHPKGMMGYSGALRLVYCLQERRSERWHICAIRSKRRQYRASILCGRATIIAKQMARDVAAGSMSCSKRRFIEFG
jgi:hypothetical protein